MTYIQWHKDGITRQRGKWQKAGRLKQLQTDNSFDRKERHRRRAMCVYVFGVHVKSISFHAVAQCFEMLFIIYCQLAFAWHSCNDKVKTRKKGKGKWESNKRRYWVDIMSKEAHETANIMNGWFTTICMYIKMNTNQC